VTLPPTIVRASAGSGKTFRLTEEVTRALVPGVIESARLDGLVAVTYTRKAEAELGARIRRALVQRGDFESAVRLPVAYLGTVHAVCMRLLEDFAIDAGLSPRLEVLPDDGGGRLRAAIEDTLEPTLIERLDELARRLEICWDARAGRSNWLRRAAEIMDLVRANRIALEALPPMAERSISGLIALLPPALADGAGLDQQFEAEISAAISRLDTEDDGTNKTADVRARLRDIQRRITQRDLRWVDWARAARLDPGAACRNAIAPLARVALQYERHPSLHGDLRAFTVAIFEAVRGGLAGYASWKGQRGIVDYIDMIDLALGLVENSHVAAELAERLDLVVVDEFQDTSPLQLALFTRLHALAGRSVWVGDGKQCIFEYAGADPLLMDAVVGWVQRQAGAAERLGTNYRSRPELVIACGALFSHAFDDVQTTAARNTPRELAATPPFGVWWLETKNSEQDAGAIGEAASRLLDAPHETPILDRTTGQVRPVQPRDIAILVATNAEAKRIASQLQRGGVRANLARDGLLATPEGVLVDSALRWLLVPRDRLSLATLEALGGWNGVGPDEWLAARLRDDSDEPPAWLRPLAGLRERLDGLAPTEALDEVIHLLDASTLCGRWPDPHQRRGNLDALRALASRYEERCARLREPATAAGLVRYFDETRQIVRARDEERASDDQFTGAGDNAVTVCTYHRAKGLEWPVVVLASLDRPEKRDAFDPAPESDRADFDPDQPLGGRWIRFWPWPFGQQRTLPLMQAAERAPEGRRVADRETRERLRLLYVGCTRARDHLVLAIRLVRGVAKATWLHELVDAAKSPILSLPTAATDGATVPLQVGSAPFECRVTRVSGATGRSVRNTPGHRLVRGARDEASTLPYRIAPSRPEAAAAGNGYRIAWVRRTGGGIPVTGITDWESLGNAVHGFLAADPYGDDQPLRLSIARRIVARLGFVGVLDPATLLSVSDQLRDDVARRWPTATWSRETPVTAIIPSPRGVQRIEGVIDLLLRVPDGVILIDHKTYPAPHEGAVRARAIEFLPQLAAYASALTRCGETVVDCCLHFPIAGAWVQLAPA